MIKDLKNTASLYLHAAKDVGYALKKMSQGALDQAIAKGVERTESTLTSYGHKIAPKLPGVRQLYHAHMDVCAQLEESEEQFYQMSELLDVTNRKLEKVCMEHGIDSSRIPLLDEVIDREGDSTEPPCQGHLQLLISDAEN